MLDLTYAKALVAVLRSRREQILRDEGGYSTEAVVVTALLAAAAIAVVTIIVVKVTGKANDIQVG